VNLDSLDGYPAVDPSDALGDVEASGRQWARAGELADQRADLAGIDAVVVTGMGGSGIGGDVLRQLAAGHAPWPVVVHKGYGLPAFVGPRTFVVATSYSGNTEETLSAFSEAGRRGARRMAITSGGKLAACCDAEDVASVRVPGGGQPRHSLGYLLVPALVALGLADGIPEAVQQLTGMAETLGRNVPVADNPAKHLAQRLAGSGIPLLLGSQGLAGVAAYRLKCQLAENAKLPAICSELPEADHNEVVAWQEPGSESCGGALISLRDRNGEHPRMRRRFEVTSELLDERFAWQAELVATGTSPLARLASLVLQGDLVSVYTALALDRDPTPVRTIDLLKTALGREAVGP
jgi:glucose/mannose-6-phosphate isomerase